MTDQQVGLVIRAIRRRRGWRQEDLARKADVDQKYVSIAERGHLTQLPLRAVRRICAALEIELPFAPRWRGPELAKLLDEGHARMVEKVASLLVARGWEVQPEFTFNHFGERGSVDLVGWHAERRALALNEIKTRVVDQQDLLASNGRKRRVAPSIIAGELGWRPASIGNLLVVLDTSTNRRVVAGHPTTFASAFPARSREVRSWLARPDGPLAGLWFLSPTTMAPGIRGSAGRVRVRAAKRAVLALEPPRSSTMRQELA